MDTDDLVCSARRTGDGGMASRRGVRRTGDDGMGWIGNRRWQQVTNGGLEDDLSCYNCGRSCESCSNFGGVTAQGDLFISSFGWEIHL